MSKMAQITLIRLRNQPIKLKLKIIPTQNLLMFFNIKINNPSRSNQNQMSTIHLTISTTKMHIDHPPINLI